MAEKTVKRFPVDGARKNPFKAISNIFTGEYALLTCAVAISIIATGAIWITIHEVQRIILKRHATENAQAWASTLITEIVQLPEIAGGRPINAMEKRQLKLASRVGRIFQYRLYNRDGLTVFSNMKSHIGEGIINPNFEKIVKKGKVFTELKYQHEGAPTEHNGARHGHMVHSAAIAPIMVNGKFHGAIEVHVDETQQLLEMRIWGNRSFYFMVALLTVLGAMIALVVRRDILRLRSREVALRSAVRSAEHANEELRKSQEKLVQAEQFATVGRVTATVSHEIRNPLGSIRNSLYMIRKKAAAADLDLVRPIERAERSVARCNDLVGDLLEYTRKNSVKMVAVDSTDYLNELLDEQALPDGITLTRDLPVPGLRIAIDLDRFRRVIINLVDNAAQAINESGAELGEIAVSCRPHGEGSVICIKDNGPGIPEDVLARIFEPLFTTKSFGAGLGLPTVKQLLEQHNAELRIDTRVGVGSTFSVLLPSAQASLGNADQQDQKEMAA